ncbi:MAG TPA: AMP-binding protein [Caulobacteraceae bacterium]|nr:AMP-binding protein [Caulobacteraceae bacterium]
MANPLLEALFAVGAPSAPAIRLGPRTISYGELLAQTGAWAAALRAAGVEAGDRIAAPIEKSIENLILYLAAVRAGAVWLPLNPAYTDVELAYFLADAEPALVVCDPPRRAALAALDRARVETLDPIGRGSMADLAAAGHAPAPPVARAASDLAAICYTSGTTGRSKGAMLTQANLLSNASALVDLWRFSAPDVLIHALPLYHVHGLFVAAHVTLLAGASMLLQPRFEPAAVLAAMGEASVLMGVPTFYSRLLAEPDLGPESAGRMRLFVSGSAPLLEGTFTAWRARTGTTILERYGLTETGMNASNPYDGERRAGTVGRPLPDVDIRIADPETGDPLALGGAGMIEVRGPNVFTGYWRNPERTAEAFRPDGYFVTGDLGRLDGDGYLSIVGRAKDLVISGGFNIYPKEIELLIDATPGVAESAVIGLPHPDLGEALVAVVVAKAGAQLAETDVLAALAPRLARYKQPRRVVFADALPRNVMGKVQKAALRDAYAGLFTAP